MQTVYDWMTIAFFAGLVVLFLQRSTGAEEKQDSMLHYIAPALGCAVTNWLGNNGYDIFAVIVFIAAITYTHHYLRPFAKS